MMNPAVTIHISNFLLCAPFLCKGISKLLQHKLFIYRLGGSASLRNGAAGLSYLVPITELMVVLLLFFSCILLLYLHSSLVLLSVFPVYNFLKLMFVVKLITITVLYALRKQQQVLKHIQYYVLANC